MASAVSIVAACGTDAAKSSPPKTATGAIDAAVGPVAAEPIAGFCTEASVQAQRARERTFLAVPSSAGVDESVKRLAAEPHMAGTAANGRVADKLAETMRGLGYEVDLPTYDVYLPHPRTVKVRVRGKAPRELAMREVSPGPDVPEDSLELTTWNAYSASGRVTAPVVDAKFARPEDLAGLDVKGKVALVRYGPLYRGAQVAHAERAGAKAVLFWVDPAEEPKRPPDSVQRGTVVYYWKHTGDPLTPGQPAKAGVPRLERAEAETLPRIVVATVTANDAQALLAEPGVEVEVTVELDDQTRPIRNVIARLPGSGPELVLLGTHYDAWVLGATDPHSGTAVLIEIARGLAALTKAGWRPRRSIVLAFWDAEEPGVLGSTEWVEEHLAELRANAVAYLNVDAIKAATVNVLGSHQYRDLVASVLATVVDPRGGKPLADGWRTRQEEAWTKKHEQPGAARRPPFEPQLGDIGIGADWTAFFYHAGVPTLQWQTAGAGPGVYQVWHSSRDSYDYYRTSTDPGFEFTPIFARAMGVTALRLADAESPPQDWGVAARRIDAWTEDLAPRAATAGLALDAAAIRRGTARLAAAAAARQTRPCATGPTPRVEQAFLVDGGIARRPWFRHLLVAGNADNGYASLPLPELAEAIQGRSQPELDAAVARLTAALDRAAALLDPDAAATPALDAPIAAVGVPGTAAPAASAETLGEDVKAVMKAIRACRAGDLDEHLVFPLRWRVDGGDGFTRRDYRDAKSLAKDRCSLAGQMTCRARLAESADKATCTDEWSNDLTHSTTKYVFTFTPVGSHWRLTAVDETLWGD